jgi:hypothetical protein
MSFARTQRQEERVAKPNRQLFVQAEYERKKEEEMEDAMMARVAQEEQEQLARVAQEEQQELLSRRSKLREEQRQAHVVKGDVSHALPVCDFRHLFFFSYLL